MKEDRLKKDYDTVENLGDLIEAREGRDSAFSQDIDGVPDADVSDLTLDVQKELSRPHKHGQTEEQRLGIEIELLDTPEEKEIEFDWQDSAEEMLPADPGAEEGMGADQVIESLAHVEPTELVEPVPSEEVSPELGSAAAAEEEEKYEPDGGDPEGPPPAQVPIESAMDTDSDQEDFSIEEKFKDQVDHETAELEFEVMREAIEEEKKEE